MSCPRAWRMVPPFKSIKLYAGIRNIIAKFVVSKIRRPLLRLVRQMSYQVEGISNLKYTRDIPDQNSGMGGYGFIPARGKMSISWMGNTHPFHKSEVFFSGMGFGYELGCTTLVTCRPFTDHRQHAVSVNCQPHQQSINNQSCAIEHRE